MDIKKLGLLTFIREMIASNTEPSFVLNDVAKRISLVMKDPDTRD